MPRNDDPQRGSGTRSRVFKSSEVHRRRSDRKGRPANDSGGGSGGNSGGRFGGSTREPEGRYSGSAREPEGMSVQEPEGISGREPEGEGVVIAPRFGRKSEAARRSDERWFAAMRERDPLAGEEALEQAKSKESSAFGNDVEQRPRSVGRSDAAQQGAQADRAKGAGRLNRATLPDPGAPEGGQAAAGEQGLPGGEPGQAPQAPQAGQTGQVGQSGQVFQAPPAGQEGQAGQTGQVGQVGQAGRTGQAGQTGQVDQAGQEGPEEPSDQGEASGSEKPKPSFRPSIRMPQSSKTRMIAGIAAVVVLVVAVAAIVFTWNRWYRFDDHADMQGTWYVVGTAVPVTIDATSIRLTDDVAYDYEIDPRDKTIRYTFGPMSGQGRYWFSDDRAYLVITDGDDFTAADTAIEDLLHMFADLPDKATGAGLKLPDGQGIIAFSRDPDPEAAAKKEADEAAKAAAEEAARKAAEEARKAEEAAAAEEYYYYYDDSEEDAEAAGGEQADGEAADGSTENDDGEDPYGDEAYDADFADGEE